jgi:predicted secreted hydrolase
MKNRLAAFCALVSALFLLGPLAAQYREAVPGYHFQFPHDYFDHPDFQTEWWYYTGNLKSQSGRHFGFELTFFRQALDGNPAPATPWDVKDLYFAHFAISDLDGQHFYHAERTNRAGPGIAGASESASRIWNGNWETHWTGTGQELQAITSKMQLQLTLHPEKPPVIHGENGVSQKAQGAGHASYYISLTRLAATGKLAINGEDLQVSGLAWMDHEFFTHQLAPDQVGWDWLSVQLEDNTELMLFHIRRKDGSIDPFSAGTYVDAQGKSTHLQAADFALTPQSQTWASPVTHAAYPIAWKIAVPKLGIELEERTRLTTQEMTGDSAFIPSYWEGAISLEGRHANAPVSGVGYLEMTGYDRAVRFAPSAMQESGRLSSSCAGPRCACRACPHDQRRLHHNFRWIGSLGRRGDPAEQRFCGDHAHFPQRLPHRGQRRILERRALNIIEPDDRHVFRYSLARFAQRLNRADRRNIVERKKRRKRLPASEQPVRHLITQQRR